MESNEAFKGISLNFHSKINENIVVIKKKKILLFCILFC
jgi:hypothetical protein